MDLGGITMRVPKMMIQELWRYPAKSMAGEMLPFADVTESGIAGDRILQVRSAAGRVMTSRTRPLLLRHHATTGPRNQVLIDGRPWTAEEVAHDVEAAAGPGAKLIEYTAGDRFDILPLLVTTDGMLAATGYDRRRFRPNIVVSGVEGLAEQHWEGARLRIGKVVIGMQDLRLRCIMTTFDPDSGKQDVGVLRHIQKDFNGQLGLNSYVITPGRISVGDTVELILP